MVVVKRIPDNVKNITIGENATGTLKIGSQGKIIVQDTTGSNRVVLGQDPKSGQMKMKLSQLGVDVTTASDDQLIWSSDFNNFKISEVGRIDISGLSAGVDSDNFSYTFVNSYTKVPAVLMYWHNALGTSNQPIPFAEHNTDSSVGFFIEVQAVWLTAVTVQAGVINTGGGASASSMNNTYIKVYVLKEVAE